jgi:cholesterol transport system auxiliary component
MKIGAMQKTTAAITLRTARNMAGLAALALLAGCISLAGKAPKLLIGLTPDRTAAAGAMAGGKVGDALVVLDPQVDRKLDVLRVAVQVNATEIAYLKDATWVERPARLMRHLLAEAIRAKGQRLVLEASDDVSGAKQTLAGRLIDLGYDSRSQSVVVRYDAMRSNAQGLIEARRFEALVPGVSANGPAVAAALNRAANDVAGQVADWVG